jgi:hypothetical protein
MTIRLVALLALSALAVGCGSKPPPPAEIPPDPPPAPKAEPPPPPKCESPGENCKATADTHARIAGSSFVFTPVSGWVYAQLSNVTIAQVNAENSPAMVIAAYDADPKDAKKELAQRDSAFTELAKEIGLTLPKNKANWKQPTCKCTSAGKACTGSGGDLCKAMKPVSDLKVNVWQLDGGTRGGKKGPMLIVQAPLEAGKALLGIGFVTDDDSSGADQSILKSIESIGPGAGGDAKADSKSDGKGDAKDAPKDAEKK